MEKQDKMDHEAWLAVIAEHAEIGGTVADFCRERGLKSHSFYWHKRRMLRDSGQSGFRQVKLPAGSTLRVIVPGSGVHVEVDRGFDRDCLRAVVQALR
jgi:transposase-like protein